MILLLFLDVYIFFCINAHIYYGLNFSKNILTLGCYYYTQAAKMLKFIRQGDVATLMFKSTIDDFAGHVLILCNFCFISLFFY